MNPAPTETQEKNQGIQKKKIVKAVWFITLKCNFKCHYCHAEQVGDPLLKYPFEKAERWVEAWNRIKEEVLIDITGGEPFIQPGFIDILQGLAPSKRVAITTNLKADITEFVQKISPEKCFSITTSLHPSQKMNVEYFLGKALLLKNRGFNVVVNFVAYPEQMWLLEHYQNIVTDSGLIFHTDPYTPGPVYPFTPSETEKKFLSRYFGSDRDDPYNKKTYKYLCDAGMNNLVVSPNGQVSPCVSRIYSHSADMGNIFDFDFRLRDKPIVCSSKFCSGCDADKIVRVVVGEGEENPIHEEPKAAEEERKTVSMAVPREENNPEEAIRTSDAAVLRSTWDQSARNVEGAMLAILHGVSDAKQFDEAGRDQAARLKKFISKEDSVLEVGCGIGRIIKHVAPWCREIHGVDISEKMLAYARNWLGGLDNVKLVQCSGKDLRVIEDDRFDFIYSLIVLQHMDKNDAYVYLKEIFRVMKEGGTALVNFPDLLSETWFRDFTYVSLTPQNERDPAKVRSYTKEEVERIVRSLGFSIMDLWVNDYIYVHLKKEAKAFPGTVMMGKDDAAALDIEGWYWLEEKEGFPYRWTRKRAPFFLKVNPSTRGVKVKLACMHPHLSEQGLDLTLYQGDQEVSRSTIREEGIQEVVFPLEPSGKEEIAHFALAVERTLNPMREKGLEDGRELGVAVSYITAV